MVSELTMNMRCAVLPIKMDLRRGKSYELIPAILQEPPAPTSSSWHPATGWGCRVRVWNRGSSWSWRVVGGAW